MTLTLLTARAEAQSGNTNIGEVSVLFWMPDPELTIQSGSLTGATGITNIDFVQEFGIEDKTFPEIRFAVGRSHKFRFSYAPIKYDADTVIERTITFQGRTFTVGVPASAEVKWDIFRFGYEWDFVSMERGFVGVIGELKFQKLEASIESPALVDTAFTDQQAPVPVIGVAGRGYVLPWVAIGGEFTAFKWDNDDDFEAKVFDFDIGGLVTFGPYIGVQGGYRAMTIDYFIDDDSGDLKVKGPYIGAVLKF